MADSEVQAQLLPILQKFAEESETGIEVGENPLDLSDEVINDYGWVPVRDTVIELLKEVRYQRLWEAGINTLYSGIRDGAPLEDKDYFIALMYACMKYHPGSRPDLYYATVWSLVMGLKKVGFTTDYEPIDDPAIKPFYEDILKRYASDS